MTRGDVELVTEAFAAFNSGDFAAAGAIFHPDAEWYPFMGAVERDVYRGRDAIVQLWREISEGFGGSFRIEAREIVAVEGGVLTVVEARGTGKESGAEVSQTWAQLATIRDALITRVESFPDREAALLAAAARRPAG